MSKIQLANSLNNTDKSLQKDIQIVQDVINELQNIFELNAFTSDPSVPSNTDKAYVWFNSTSSKIKFSYNGTVQTVTST